MQIVIEISEEYYDALHKAEILINTGQRNGKTLESIIYSAVANGTPLPKGHGDLIDRQALLHIPYEQENYIGLVEWYDEIEDAPTIIPADEGKGEYNDIVE